jgi:hypothetical protein
MIDVTTSLMMAGEPPVGITRVEGEISRRLLATSELDATAVAFRDGHLFALAPQDVERIFAAGVKGGSEEPRLRRRRMAPAAGAPVGGDADEAGNGASGVSPVPPPAGLRGRATAALRRAARASVSRMPDPVREDVRAILIHGRQILRRA